MKLSCLRCSDDYEVAGRRSSHFCEPCRRLNKREADRERNRVSRALAIEVREAGAEFLAAGALDQTDAPPWWASVDNFLASMAFDPDDGPALVPDRRPANSASPAGAWEGESVDPYSELGGVLKERRALAVSDPWWAANQHCFEGIHEFEQPRELEAAA